MGTKKLHLPPSPVIPGLSSVVTVGIHNRHVRSRNFDPPPRLGSLKVIYNRDNGSATPYRGTTLTWKYNITSSVEVHATSRIEWQNPPSRIEWQNPQINANPYCLPYMTPSHIYCYVRIAPVTTNEKNCSLLRSIPLAGHNHVLLSTLHGPSSHDHALYTHRVSHARLVRGAARSYQGHIEVMMELRSRQGHCRRGGSRPPHVKYKQNVCNAAHTSHTTRVHKSYAAKWTSHIHVLSHQYSLHPPLESTGDIIVSTGHEKKNIYISSPWMKQKKNQDLIQHVCNYFKSTTSRITPADIHESVVQK